MSVANIQKIQANRCKRLMLEQGNSNVGVVPKLRKLTKVVNKKEEGAKLLGRILKRKLQRNFDSLQMGSIDYKRSLLLKREKKELG
mmetsp:Transcript_10017/g.13627  ORF Transcript_10017/g.13627 Transcript_10017/m.13627 type:complete len:86 (+) Transcript_10017:875-1132(+)